MTIPPEVAPRAHACIICAAARHQYAELCPRCKKARDRLDTRAKKNGRRTNKQKRVDALKASGSTQEQAFLCHYSGVALVDDRASPWHLTFDHRTPRDEDDVVICAALINDMKSDLDDAGFRAVVAGLADVFRGMSRRLDTLELRLKHWKRI